MLADIIIPSYSDEKYICFFTTKLLKKEPIDFIRQRYSKESILYMPIQRHTDLVVNVNFETSSSPQIADAAITSDAGLFIGVKTADCVPILIIDKVKAVIAAIHAGWRGTAQRIVQKTIQKMISDFDCNIYDLMVLIGPSVKMCCYEVGFDIYSKIIEVSGESNYFKKERDRYFLDLQIANKTQCLKMGIKNFWISDDCTCCLKDKYHSYRRDKEKALRQYAIIGINAI